MLSGYFVLASIAFILGFVLFLPLATGFGDFSHVVIMLDAHPDSVVALTADIFLLGILPNIVGLVFLIIAFMKARRVPMKESHSLVLLILGSFLTVWGLPYFLGAYNTYVDACGMTYRCDINHINGSLGIIYAMYGAIGVPLVLSGMLLIVMYIVPNRSHEALGNGTSTVASPLNLNTRPQPDPALRSSAG